MKANRTAFIHGPQIEQYSYPQECPFSTSRAPQARKMLASMGLLSGPGRSEVAPTQAGREELLTFHEEAYLDKKFGSVYQDYKSRVRRWL